MGVVIQKQKEKTTPKVKKDELKATQPLLNQAERQAVDELCMLVKTLEPYLEKLKLLEGLKKFLVSVSLDKDRFKLDEPVVLKGDLGEVEFGPQQHPREITDMHGLIVSLKEKVGGYENLLPLLKVTMGDIDKYLTEAEQKPFIGEKNGTRVFKSARAVKGG